jgi:lipopolysaccharide transport system ATP-binding protein
MTPAISIEDLSKRYTVDHEVKQRGGYRTLRESLVDLAAAPLRRLRGQRSSTREDFWALKDVSFEVQPGEVVGIIGRNGAGKSTLLKVLSQITKPTTGRVTLNGRVGSLLEVGTGFHPELTGRENIYLNGSILGMGRAEIERKFDEIVDFSGVERFLDTPVKRYSSGMYVRLAFSVAAHLEPEILIIDEVLAVGDAAFQQRCVEKMQSVAQSGRTVFLVSHNLGVVKTLCTHAVALDMGRLADSGEPQAVIKRYLDGSTQQVLTNAWLDLSASRRDGDGAVRLSSLLVTSESGMPLVPWGPLSLRLKLSANESRNDCFIAIRIRDRIGQTLIHVSGVQSRTPLRLRAGINEFQCRIPSVALVPGTYIMGLSVGNGHDLFDRISDAALIEVQDNPIDPGYGWKSEGFIACECNVAPRPSPSPIDSSLN